MTLAQRAYEAMVILNPNVGEDDLKAARSESRTRSPPGAAR